MIRSLNTAQTAMQHEQVRIDALANNLANVNTAGFQQILTRVAENGGGGVTDPGTDQLLPGDQPAQMRASGDGGWTPELPINMYHAVDTRPGTLMPTGRPTDIALTGPGYFVVQDPSGERYTRDGSFRLDDEKRLTTPDGRVVLGTSGPITIDANDFSIEVDGTVIADGQSVGQLKVVNFADASRLQHLGGSLLVAGADMEAVPVAADQVSMSQGHIEGSNVDPINTLVAMIVAQRAFEVVAQVLTTEDEMLNKSVNSLPRVGQ